MVGGDRGRWWVPRAPATPSPAHLCRFSVPAVGALMGPGEMATLGSLRELFPGCGLCLEALWGAASGYGLSIYLVSKAVGVS